MPQTGYSGQPALLAVIRSLPETTGSQYMLHTCFAQCLETVLGRGFGCSALTGLGQNVHPPFQQLTLILVPLLQIEPLKTLICLVEIVCYTADRHRGIQGGTAALHTALLVCNLLTAAIYCARPAVKPYTNQRQHQTVCKSEDRFA